MFSVQVFVVLSPYSFFTLFWLALSLPHQLFVILSCIWPPIRILVLVKFETRIKTTSMAAVQNQIEGSNQNSCTSVHCNAGEDKHLGTAWDSKESSQQRHERVPKVRKPYTLTKQREKWTEEEHGKFLEALKLYGRGWSKIQEHIGSKTAVQIRSHAQKFFSKLARDSSSGREIEIPPPRPKRKPLHPYPRKSVDNPDGTSCSNSLERTPSPDLHVAEKEKGSPVSVLSALASETAGSMFPDGCSSPTSFTTNTQATGLLPIKKENENTTSNLTENEEKSSSMLVQQSSQLVADEQLSRKHELDQQEATFVERNVNSVSTFTSFKLFGKTVIVTAILENSSTDALKYSIGGV